MEEIILNYFNDITVHGVLGTIGTVLFLISYLRLNIRRRYARDHRFYIRNSVAALLVGVHFIATLNIVGIIAMALCIVFSLLGIYRSSYAAEVQENSKDLFLKQINGHS